MTKDNSNKKNKKKSKNKKYLSKQEYEDFSKYKEEQSKIRFIEKIRSSWKNNSSNIQKEYKKEKDRIKNSNNLQFDYKSQDEVSSSLGTSIGVIVKQEKVNKKTITYKQSECSCYGSNERCIRCDGTGFYLKKIVEELVDLLPKKIERKNKKFSEVNFSNDQRGDSFGIREIGRFSSNPLHDDHD